MKGRGTTEAFLSAGSQKYLFESLEKPARYIKADNQVSASKKVMRFLNPKGDFKLSLFTDSYDADYWMFNKDGLVFNENNREDQ